MSKNGLERAADLAKTVKAISDIIKAGLRGGWAGAAVAALKAYWPKILPIAAVLILLPAIIVVSLPAILFGFSGTPEEVNGTQMLSAYEKYALYMYEQLREIKDGIERQGFTCSIEYVNEPFEQGWLIAIDCVNNDNDLDHLSEENLKDLIKLTYTYEIIDKTPSPEGLSTPTPSPEGLPAPTPTTNPWNNTAPQTSDPVGETGAQEPDEKIMVVTTLDPVSVMEKLNFDEEKVEWASFLHETYSQK